MFNPSTTTHLEFNETPVTQTVSLISDEGNNEEYVIENVTYTTSNGVKFDDLTLSWDGNIFTYSSKFEWAVNTPCYYFIQKDHNPNNPIEYKQAVNFKELPPDYDVLYKVGDPDPSMTITFEVMGKYRTVSLENGTSGGWQDFQKTFITTIETNLTRFMTELRAAVSNGYYSKQAL